VLAAFLLAFTAPAAFAEGRCGEHPWCNTALSPEERATAVAWINEKTKNDTCPVCGTNSWALGEHLLQGTAFRPGGVFLGGPFYPQVFIVCLNCGYTRQFIASHIGIDPQRVIPLPQAPAVQADPTNRGDRNVG